MLPPGLILDVARRAGITVPKGAYKVAIRCPFHDDTIPSAFLSDRNIFYCSVCTPRKGLGAKTFAKRLGVPLDARAPLPTPQASRSRRHVTRTQFTSTEACRVWSSALNRVRDDAHVEDDRAIYEYLHRRSLAGVRGQECYGILGEGMDLPSEVSFWPAQGYQILVPLFDLRGNLVNVEAKCIQPRTPKTRFPRGSRTRGLLIASPRGAELLGDPLSTHEVILLAEGLTDFLALSSASSVPVLGLPSSGSAASVVGAWMAGKRLLLAFDEDQAGAGATETMATGARRQDAINVRRIVWPGECTDACEALDVLGVDTFGEYIDRAVQYARCEDD